jgi:hypothetical protein
MLRIRFTQNEGCDISGRPIELRGVSERISQLAAAGQGSHSFSGDISASPKPYDRFLMQLIVRVTCGPVCAIVKGDALIVEAGAEFLVPFASFFNFSDDVASGYHHHHEYWEGNDYVSPNSVPLVISVQ